MKTLFLVAFAALAAPVAAHASFPIHWDMPTWGGGTLGSGEHCDKQAPEPLTLLGLGAGAAAIGVSVIRRRKG